MKIVIEQDISGTGEYHWKLFTGPERIDWYEGIADSLGEAFEKVLIAETINAQHYREEPEND
jgi:hypothetical protein